MSVPRRFSRDQRLRILAGIVSIVVLIVVLQLWLLTATMNAYLGGDHGVALPAAADERANAGAVLDGGEAA